MRFAYFGLGVFVGGLLTSVGVGGCACVGSVLGVLVGFLVGWMVGLASTGAGVLEGWTVTVGVGVRIETAGVFVRIRMVGERVGVFVVTGMVESKVGLPVGLGVAESVGEPVMVGLDEMEGGDGSSSLLVGEGVCVTSRGVAVGTGNSRTAVTDASRSGTPPASGSLSRIRSRMIASPTTGTLEFDPMLP